MRIPKFRIDHLNPSQQEALKELQHIQDIISKPSDKGGNVVLLTTDQYETICQKIINNNHWYRRIDESITTAFIKDFKELVWWAFRSNIITKNMLEFLIVEFPVTPSLYSLPKIHEIPQDPPGRPIISGIGSYTAKAN